MSKTLLHLNCDSKSSFSYNQNLPTNICGAILLLQELLIKCFSKSYTGLEFKLNDHTLKLANLQMGAKVVYSIKLSKPNFFLSN